MDYTIIWYHRLPMVIIHSLFVFFSNSSCLCLEINKPLRFSLVPSESFEFLQLKRYMGFIFSLINSIFHYFCLDAFHHYHHSFNSFYFHLIMASLLIVASKTPYSHKVNPICQYKNSRSHSKIQLKIVTGIRSW